MRATWELAGPFRTKSMQTALRRTSHMGCARSNPCSLRVSSRGIPVCYPDRIDQVIGDPARVVGSHAHNTLGMIFPGDIYPALNGSNLEPISAAECRRTKVQGVVRYQRESIPYDLPKFTV